MIANWMSRAADRLALFRVGALLCLLLVISPRIYAVPASVMVLPSADSGHYQAVISRLTRQLAGMDLNLYIARSDEPLSASLQQYDLVVTVGTKATQRVLDQHPRPPLLSTFVPKATFEALTEGLQQQISAGRISALYLEQPLSRQLDLLAFIRPQTRSFATMLGPSSAKQQPLIEAAAQRQGWELYLDKMNSDDNPIKKLTPLIRSSDAFVVVPDQSVFNRNTARWILLMTLRQRIPLIAYSKRYVDAGALAAVYSTTETVGDETALLIEDWLQQHQLRPPQYPELFEISTNPKTALTLRLELPDIQVLNDVLRESDSP